MLAAGAVLALLVVRETIDASQLNAKGMGAVLSLPSGLGEPPSLGAALRDPELLRHKPEDGQDASRLAMEIKEARSDLGRSKGERALELHEQAYQNAISLSYYLEDTGAAAQLASIRGIALQHAQSVLKMSNDAGQKARAQFHLNATLYVTGKNRAQAIDAMRALAKGRLPAALKTRARMLAAMHDVDHGPAAQRAKAATTLAALAKSLPAESQVAARLVAARALAGLDRSGRRVAQPNASYRGQLGAAAQRAAGLDEARREAVLRYMIAVWRGAESSADSWQKPPFSTAAFKGSLTALAVTERAALADWQAGRRPQAIKRYETVARSLTGNPMRAPVDLRILDLRRADAQAARTPRAYERALLAMHQAYLDTGLLGEGNEARVKAMSGEIARRHEALVTGELTRAASASASRGDRLTAIAMANAFLATIDDNQRIEDVKGRIAGLYALNGQHAEAVALYKELAETGSNANARKYWALAIRSQSKLAAWPEQAPWGGIKAGHAQEREELLVLYRKLEAASGQQLNWFFTAQTGLLELSLGRADAAFAAWGEALKKDARGPHAANAAGTMLVAYKNARSWAELESLARLCLAQRVAPLYRGSAVGAVELLALSLLEGGKLALEEGQFAVAVKKLKEFVQQHQTAKNHDEGFFLLATAYRGATQHKESIQTLIAFVERYPRSGYYRQALLNGGDWSAPLAFEDNAMFFYRRFAEQHGDDQEAPRVRTTLSELYLGRGIYAEAIHTLQLHVRARNVDAAGKSAALASIMDLEERQGSVPRADAAASLLIKASDASEEAKAEAYALKARLASKAGKIDELRRIEGELAGLGASNAMTEALGETRFYIASIHSRSVPKKHFNLELTDPLATLEQRFTAYAGARDLYARVCEGGVSSFCAPAQHNLARLGESFVASVEDIQIQDTLAKEVVQRFSSRKQQIVNTVSAETQTADARAVQAVGEGSSDPDWTQAVLWQNTSDWNFERVSGETGNAYVQWAVPAAAAE